jgi:hypothetical protein
MRPRRFALNVALLACCAGVALGAQTAGGQGRHSITGVVRDSAGPPLADAEVLLIREGASVRSVRTSRNGAFTIDSVAAGLYTVWFRQVGWASVNYRWDTSEEARTEVRISLRRLAKTLNPVVIREAEDRGMRQSAGLLGLVLDGENNPVDEVTVEIVGTSIGGVTRPNGGFLFKPIPSGSYVVRARKIGYSPANYTMSLIPGEERELVLRLQRLATSLDAVQITELSGFGSGQTMLADLGRRLRWHGVSNFVLGPDDLRRYGTRGLDEVGKRIGVDFKEMVSARRRGGPRSINGASIGVGVGSSGVGRAQGDACILLDGKFAVSRPLSSFVASEIELLEIYPTRTEVTETISDRMHGSCAKSPSGDHPTYYVIWTRGSLKR